MYLIGNQSLENNFRVKATKKIINPLKIFIEKPLIVAKAKVDSLSKITAQAKKASKQKKVD